MKNPKKQEEIRAILKDNGIKISDAQNCYTGGRYYKRYEVIGCKQVKRLTEYNNTPYIGASQGFYTRNGVIENYFSYNDKGFDTTTNINDFLTNIKQ
jgi:hypothetical protein